MKRVAHLLEIAAALTLLPAARFRRLRRGTPPAALVAGWWGSETIGDVAILGQLLVELRQVAPDATIAISSFRPSRTRETLRDLQMEDVIVLPVGVRSGWATVASRCLVFGGGPLMESPSMPVWALRAWAARLAGASVALYACGVGPIRRWRTRLAISSLLRAATHVVLRDEASRRAFEALAGGRDAAVAFDPAYDYVAALPGRRPSRDARQIALVLRAPTRAYLEGEGEEAAAERLLGVIGEALNRLQRERPDLHLIGLAMDTGHAESDDHQVYARLRAALDRPDRLSVAPGRHSLAHVALGLASSKAALTVRFHGMVFALATGTPFVAIDYSPPAGKVSATAECAGVKPRVVAWADLDGPAIAEALLRALDEPDLAPCRDLDVDGDLRRAALAAALGGQPERP